MSQVDTLLKQGIHALKAGQKQQARALLTQVVDIDERNEQAWLWLSAAVDSPEEQEICLENVLTINPNNPHAQRGLEKVQQKMGKTASQPVYTPPPVEPQPAPTPPQPTLQMPASWQEEEKAGGTAPVAAPSPATGASGSFLDSLDAEAATAPAVTWKKKKGKPNLAELLAEDARLPAAEKKQKTGKRGFIALFDAWISALIFDGKGAYQAELEVANIGRTVLNVVICSIASTVVVVAGVLIGMAPLAAFLGEALPIGSFLVGGAQLTGEMAVIYAPFQVIFFFALAFGMYRAARLFGSDQTFYDHVHIFSIAYAPTLIVLSFILMLVMLLPVMLIGQVQVDEYGYPVFDQAALDRYNTLTPILGGVFLIGLVYTLVVWGHSLGTVHRQGVAVGVVVAIVGLLVSVLVTIPATCCILSNLMSLGNPTYY